ncbi:MAG: helix-turn-helix transcriptional regulator [Pseudomonadota bacterium]
MKGEADIATDIDGGPIAARIREALARRRKSRQWLADEARISLSTLEKALGGRRRFTLATLIRIEDALGISLRGEGEPSTGSGSTAPDHLGAYSRAAVGWLEKDYVMLRPSAGAPGSVYAHRLAIGWDDASGHLVFRESERVDADYSQSGNVGVSALSGHIYLITNELGQYRLVILGRPASGGTLYGLLTTLQVGRGSALLPVSTPLALLPSGDDAFGRISPGHAQFERYRAEVDRVLAGGYAEILS